MTLGFIIGFSVLAVGLFGIGVVVCMHCKLIFLREVSNISTDRKKRASRRAGGQRGRGQNTELVNQLKGSNNSVIS